MTVKQRLRAVYFVSVLNLLLPVDCLGIWSERRSLETLFDEANNLLPRFSDITPSILRRQNVDYTQLSATDKSSDTSNALWILEDEYAAPNFFDNFTFYTGPDPTNGLVNYVDADTAFSQGLAFVTDNNTVVMSGDNTTWLPLGTNRNSVRVSSNKTYNGGLFILDVNRAPWGCGVWPAFWTFSATETWPYGGEIDIIEGVHDNVHNQVTWHTGPGCNLLDTGNFTGSLVGQTDCDGTINNNAGCGITDFSKVSYGETFDAQGGGIYAMLWDETGIAVSKLMAKGYFYRVSIPQDIVDGAPKPTTWTTPSASLAPAGCDPFEFFVNHSIIFDITFCGDWAGNTYSTTPGCPGTCQEHLQDPSNFVNASWDINNLKVYTKQVLAGTVSSDAVTLSSGAEVFTVFSLVWIIGVICLL